MTTKYKGIDLAGLNLQIDIDLAKAFIDHRKSLKAPITQRAFDSAMKTALKSIQLEAYDIRMTPNDVIAFVVDETTWRGINLTWIMNRVLDERLVKSKAMDKMAQLSNQGTRTMSLEHQLTDKSWAN